MPVTPEWEYNYRWADISADSLAAHVDELEERDRALEFHMLFYGGGTCEVDFEYPYRWSQIVDKDEATQIALLDTNMTELEHAINESGGCTLEFPYRWSQFWPGLLQGEPWAVACAEENDRAIELRFGQCSCGCQLGLHSTWHGSPSFYSTTSSGSVLVENVLSQFPNHFPSSGTPPVIEPSNWPALTAWLIEPFTLNLVPVSSPASGLELRMHFRRDNIGPVPGPPSGLIAVSDAVLVGTPTFVEWTAANTFVFLDHNLRFEWVIEFLPPAYAGYELAGVGSTSPSGTIQLDSHLVLGSGTEDTSVEAWCIPWDQVVVPV